MATPEQIKTDYTRVGEPYDRPNRERQYLCYDKHAPWSLVPKASRWVAREIERSVFDAADYGNFALEEGQESWSDQPGRLFGFDSTLRSIGRDNEVFALFRAGATETERWHGFPIDDLFDHKVNIKLLRRWKDADLISKAQYSDIIDRVPL